MTYIIENVEQKKCSDTTYEKPNSKLEKTKGSQIYTVFTNQSNIASSNQGSKIEDGDTGVSRNESTSTHSEETLRKHELSPELMKENTTFKPI